MFSLRNALIAVLVLIATGLGVWVANAALTQVTVVFTIDETDPAGFTNPVDDDCPVGMACKVKSDLSVLDTNQPASSVTSISPTAFGGTVGTLIPNGTVVGNTHVVVEYAALGDCSSGKVTIDETSNFLDGVIMGEVPYQPSDDEPPALLDPYVWPTRLEHDLRVSSLLSSHHPVLRRSVAVLVLDLPWPVPDIQVPVNLLSFDVSDGNGFGDPPLTLRGTYNVAVVGDPETAATGAMCTPTTSASILLGRTAAGLELLTCQALGTHTMTTVLTREVGGALVFDANVSDTATCLTAAVGGIAEFTPLEPDAAAGQPSSSVPGTPLLAGLAAGGALLLAGGAWYARRRRLS